MTADTLKNINIGDIEIMAPVGSRESLAAAIQAGADSIYFGIGQLNMRSHSANHFTIADLHEIADTCNQHGIKPTSPSTPSSTRKTCLPCAK